MIARVSSAISAACFETRKSASRRAPGRPNSAEFYIGEEFIGVLFEDNDEGERSYNLQIAILNEDLDD